MGSRDTGCGRAGEISSKVVPREAVQGPGPLKSLVSSLSSLMNLYPCYGMCTVSADTKVSV